MLIIRSFVFEPDGMRNGSKTNDRMISTNSKTGKNDCEYSTNTCRLVGASFQRSARCHMNLFIATISPVSAVNTVNINARLKLKVTSLVRAQDGEKRLLWYLNRTDLLHASLASLLFLQ